MGKKVLQVLSLDAEALSVRGPDAEKFLQGMITSDVKRARSLLPATGGGCETFLLDVKGKIVAPCKLLALKPEEFHLVTPQGEGAKVVEALEKLHVADDLEIHLLNPGPWKNVYLGFSLPPFWKTKEEILIPSPTPGALDEIYKVSETKWGGTLPAPEWGEGWAYFFVASTPAFSEEFDTKSLAASHVEQRRVERGIPQWNKDFNRDSLVLEFPHDREISFFKGCYLGQEIVARATYRGSLPKGFFRFVSDGGALSEGFVYNTEDPEKPVGRVTSAAVTRGLGQLRFAALDAGKLFQLGKSQEKIPLQAEALTRKK